MNCNYENSTNLNQESDQNGSECKLNDILDALYKASKIITSQFGQQEMLENLLSSLEDDFQLTRSIVMLSSPDGKELIAEAIQDDSERPARREVRYSLGEGITGQVLASGKPEIIPHISKEPRFKDRIFQRGRSGEMDLSFICVPIILGPDVIGTLAVDVPFRSHAHLEQLRKLLSIVSGIIASDAKARWTARLERETVERENATLRTALKERFRPENIIGNSRAMSDIYSRIHLVAPGDTTVLIRGESGTGKELVASAIHYTSNRSNKPFIRVNCAALNESLLESELFGHEKGAFTGALYSRVGRIEEAQGGTLFLDEVGEFTPGIQVKLLRVLQEREYERVGSNQTRKADVRIIAATNRNLEKAVDDGEFRQDLYYRINVFPIMLPALRERKDDILLLANFFVDRHSKKLNKKIRRISTSAINMLMSYHWPGNVRELENCMEHAVLLSNDEVIHAYNMPATLQVPIGNENVSRGGSLKTRVQVLERDLIIDSLKRTKGNVNATAKELGITARMVRYKIQNLGVDTKAIRANSTQ